MTTQFAAPAGVSDVTVEGATFAVDQGILSMTDALADILSADLVTLGFVNLGSANMATIRVVTGEISASGPSDTLLGLGTLNVSVWPVDPDQPVTASFALERSFDNGMTWLPVTALSEAIVLTGPFSTSFEEAEAGVLYRLNCAAFQGGAANYRLSHA